MRTIKWLAVLLGLIAPCLAAEPKPLQSMGLSMSSLENPFFVALVKGAEAKARSINPSVKITTLANDYSIAKQEAHIDRFIEEHTDLILVNAADPHKLQGVLEKARAAGSVVVAVDVTSDGADAAVLTDNRKAGELACTFLANALGGKGRVVIQSGPQVSSVIDRVVGCRTALKAHTGIAILADDGDGKASRWGGMQLMAADIKRFGKIDGVFAINDRQAIGADTAAQQAGMKRLVITSVDGAPDIEQAMHSPSFVEASATQDPYVMAQRGVALGYEIMNGHRPPSPTVLIAPGLLTRANLGQYKGWEHGQ